MTRTEAIILRVRDTLSDPKAERWSDDRLLRLIDEAQETIAVRASLLHTDVVLYMHPNQKEYTIGDDTLNISRVLSSSNVPLPVVSHEYADRHYGSDWEAHTGNEVKAIIYDRANLGNLKVYPIPTDDSLTEAEYVSAEAAKWDETSFNFLSGVTVDSESPWDTFNSVYGSIVDINYHSTFNTETGQYTEIETSEFNSVYGVIVTLEDALLINTSYDPNYGIVASAEGTTMNGVYGITVFEDDTMSAQYGVTSSLADDGDHIKVYTYKKSAPLATQTSELDLGPRFDRVIKFYVTGMALRDDKDTQNRQLGVDELSLFSAELAEILKDKARDHLDSQPALSVPYVSAFDA